MDMFLGFGVSNYRSFTDLRLAGPLKKINVFIGRNNSGKSNVLRFAQELLPGLMSNFNGPNPNLPIQAHDRPLGSANNAKFQIACPIALENEQISRYKALVRSAGVPSHESAVDQFLTSDAMSFRTPCAWVIFDSKPNGQYEVSLDQINNLSHSNPIHPRYWNPFASAALKLSQSQNIPNLTPIQGNPIAVVLEALSPFGIGRPSRMPNVELIPTGREITEAKSGELHPSGRGIIPFLAKLQHPEIGNLKDKDKFQKINNFAKSVVGNESVYIEIPDKRDMIIVHMDGKPLPLEYLGTGIHQVVILAATLTIISDKIICIEEPETNLHPHLQRKLMQYIAKNTDNQYLITTHSATIMDTEDAQIFHVTHNGAASDISLASDTHTRCNICFDLGVRPSDLLQTNCILWVEGPSDRLYLNWWIHDKDESLIEGLHYSIMFYGGRLLSHLSADDTDVTDFINLRCLNQRSMILVDSDKAKAQLPINLTKQRIKSEFDTGPGFCWITKGREIENYVDRQLLCQAVKRAHPTAKQLISTGQYDHAYHFLNGKNEEKRDVDKLSIAHGVIKNKPNFGVLDLGAMINKLVVFIQESNKDD